MAIPAGAFRHLGRQGKFYQFTYGPRCSGAMPDPRQAGPQGGVPGTDDPEFSAGRRVPYLEADHPALLAGRLSVEKRERMTAPASSSDIELIGLRNEAVAGLAAVSTKPTAGNGMW